MTDDYLLKDQERSQQRVTDRRRSNRSRRGKRIFLIAAAVLSLIVLAAPSLMSHLGVTKSLLASTAKQMGWEASAESVVVGWITPLTIKGLELKGQAAGTQVKIERADTALTLRQLISLDPARIGEVSVRGIKMAVGIAPGGSSLEADLKPLLGRSSSEPSTVHAKISLQDAHATIHDLESERSWTVSQSNIALSIDGDQIAGDVAGVVNEPGGSGGAIQCKFDWDRSIGAAGSQGGTIRLVSQVDPDEISWNLSIDTDSFPLSVTQLVSRRYATQAAGMPSGLSGDTTGHLQLVGTRDSSVRLNLGDVQIRNLNATVGVPGQQADQKLDQNWNNQLATLDGEVSLSGGWLVGRGLKVTTDFASATLDGAFPTTISWVGSDDNILNWLKTLDGRARLNVDLASLDKALPGLIPLRQNATLVSGQAHMVIENESDSDDETSTQISKLTISSNALRARSGGRIVVIDPMELKAIVTDERGALRAERFELSSSFAKAHGSGTLRDGKAEVEIDFGQLYTMLQPVVDLSTLSMGGTADGQIRWSVKRSIDGRGDQWDLGGEGEARNLLLSLPGGLSFKRAIVQGDLQAKGNWDGRALRELSSADVAIRSGGLSVHTALMSPVDEPTADSSYHLQVRTDGRLENFGETLGQWMKLPVRGLEGRVTGSAEALVSRTGGTVSKVDLVLTQPRINYANSWYTQPKLTVRYAGEIIWPSGDMRFDDTTVVGPSLSVGLNGHASAGATDLVVNWNADLEGLQRSVGSTIAKAASTTLVRPISFRAVRKNPHRVKGQCEGKVHIKGDASVWTYDTRLTATDFALYRPAEAGVAPPGTTVGTYTSSSPAVLGPNFGHVSQVKREELLWQEPQILVEGTLRFDRADGQLESPGMKIQTDWFQGALKSSVLRQGDDLIVTVGGPSRLQVEQVAERLTGLLGVQMIAEGVHETEFEVRVVARPGRKTSLAATGSIGWDRCQAAGVRLGAGSVDFELTEQKLRFDETRLPIMSTYAPDVPVQQPLIPLPAGQSPIGHVSAAGEINYSITPATVRLKSGAKIESLRITPVSAASWLKYLTPLAADSTRIDGVASLELDHTLIVVGRPEASSVRGRLDVQNIRISSGPLADQLVRGVSQIKSLASLGSRSAAAVQGATLIEMPPQSVDFTFEEGIATHQRMYFQIDRASLMTSGQVATSGEINLVALVPLDANWLGSDLQGLAGQTLSFPITGTLSRPRLDDSAVRNVMAELGTKAGAQVIENRLDGLIQKQLGSGMDQINSGLGKIFPF